MKLIIAVVQFAIDQFAPEHNLKKNASAESSYRLSWLHLDHFNLPKAKSFQRFA
jgi:hypothetical protein